MIQAGACQESAVSSLLGGGAGPAWRLEGPLRRVAQLGRLQTPGGLQLSQRLGSQRALHLRSHPWPPCWPLPAWLAALGPPQPLGLEGSCPAPGTGPRLSWKWRPLDLLCWRISAPLTTSPSASGRPRPRLGVQGGRGPASRRSGEQGSLPVSGDLPFGRRPHGDRELRHGEALWRGGLQPCARAGQACPVHPSGKGASPPGTLASGG